MNWKQNFFWGITYRQAAFVLAFYGLAAVAYDGALSLSGSTWSQQSLWFDFQREITRVLLDYGLKLLLTVPIWYLLFVRLRRWPLFWRVGLHLVLLPLFVACWQFLYYSASDVLHIGYLKESAQVWDTYIGGLFYLVQFGIFHAYSYHRDLQQQRTLESELRQLALQSELSALKAQLNPHFLYNVFNTISASVPPAQERTRELLAELADLFRYQLQASKSDIVSVREELAFVRKYLDLEKARFGDRLQFRFQVANEVLDYYMPPMLLQPLVENSVRHGLASLIEGGEIDLRLERVGNRLRITVSDTGVGLTTSPMNSLGVGLTNTRLRLAKMYGSELTIMKNKPRGVRIEFAIPLIHPNEKLSGTSLPERVLTLR